MEDTEKQQTYVVDNGRVSRIISRLLRLQERIEPMNKGCVVIDFAGEREVVKVTEIMEE